LEEKFRRQLEEQTQTRAASLDVLVKYMADMATIVANLMPYVPLEQRKRAIDASILDDVAKQPFYLLAEKAPELKITLSVSPSGGSNVEIDGTRAKEKK
jgi:hypothetical protein